MSKHFGYWVFGKDMNNVDLQDCKNKGVTDIFLNYYAFTAHGESKVLKWIKNAKDKGINTHIWMQCFYDGEWINPVTNKNIVTNKIKEAKKYSKMANVYGVHLDYLRFPGNAHKTKGGTEAITNFVKSVRKECSNIFLSCAVMPENEDDKYYYGQDIDALGKTVDAILPMQYKGNYEQGTNWLISTSKYFSKRAKLWSGLQTYKSDEDTTLLSTNELNTDIKNCLNNGAEGVILFRYGLSQKINFKTYTATKQNTNVISANEIKSLANGLKEYIEKNKKFPTKYTLNNKTYTYGQIAYILSYHINNLNKSCEVFKVAGAEHSNGDKVKEDIYADDYKDIAKRTSDWIKKNKMCPNYATTKKSKKRLRPRVFIYMMARIIVYYYKNNRLPNYATVNYKFFYK